MMTATSSPFCRSSLEAESRRVSWSSIAVTVSFSDPAWRTKRQCSETNVILMYIAELLQNIFSLPCFLSYTTESTTLFHSPQCIQCDIISLYPHFITSQSFHHLYMYTLLSLFHHTTIKPNNHYCEYLNIFALSFFFQRVYSKNKHHRHQTEELAVFLLHLPAKQYTELNTARRLDLVYCFYSRDFMHSG